MHDNTRLFFVVDSMEDNEEIFETMGEALNHYMLLRANDKPRIYIAMVKNAYREPDVKGNPWNYDDRDDTFEFIKKLTHYNV